MMVILIISPLKRALCLALIGLGSVAYAEKDAPAYQATPIYVANQNPFVQIFGLPKPEPGTITPKGRLDAGFLYYVSNNAIKNDDETLIWDGETAQYNFRVRYGFSDQLELGVDVPFIDHSGGYLDSVIRQFHRMFGYPNDRQEQFDKNQIHYKVDEKGTGFEMQERQSGLGDIRFSAAIPLFSKSLHSQRYLALRPLLKLPTGDSQHLLGSGGTDVSMSLAYSDYETLGGINTVLSANCGVIYMGNTKVLRGLQRHFAGYGGVSLDWLATKHLEFKLQLDMHSAFYESEFKQLGSSIQLLAGGTARLPGEVLLDLGMSQQVVTDSTPDLGLYLSLRHLF